MKSLLRRQASYAALIISVAALVVSMTGVSVAERSSQPSVKPRPYGVLLLNKKKKFPASVIPRVRSARNAQRLGGKTLSSLTETCGPDSVDIGTYCLMSSPYPVPAEELGRNNYFYATQKCAEIGGYVPTAAQLIGGAPVIKLAGTIDDNPVSASVDEDPTDGVKDRREMSATLVTTGAGSSAAGSQGVSIGSRGDPRQGEGDPLPAAADPIPETLQYVTVYDDGGRGGFAGSKPVGSAENFRCAFEKLQQRDQRRNER